MITRLRMQNFKSWRDTGELEIAPLTGLFGTNSSGKTSIMQMLLMLKQTVEFPDRRRVLYMGGDERSWVDLGTYEDVVHGHHLDETLTLNLSWNVETTEGAYLPEIDDMIRELISTETHFSFTSSIRQVAERVVLERFVYRLEHTQKEFGMFRLADNGYGIIYGGHLLEQVPGTFRFPLVPVKCYGLPDSITWGGMASVLEGEKEVEPKERDLSQTLIEDSSLFEDSVLAFEELFSRIVYLGPLRDYPRRVYLWGGDRPTDVGRRGENTIAALLAARADQESYYKNTIEGIILKWMRDMGLIHSFRLKPLAENRRDYEFVVKMSENSSEVLITDVGFGVSQILPVLVLCYYVPEGSIILLEQPEMHLHPSAQAGLADVLIDVVKNRNVQIIIESHSEHLLTRIQRRIAEGEISSEQAALYFCHMDNGESKIERLKLDPFGSISNWPPNFFGDMLGERIAATEAAVARMGAESE